jgi:tetratricopeptide (TPR) repeat protein
MGRVTGFPALPIDELLAAVLRLDEQRPHPDLPRRLDPLFRELSRFSPADPPHEVEDLIWALWTNHPDCNADRRMEQAIAAIATKRLDVAEVLLDELVAAWPTFAEAWNKRATLHFIRENDAASCRDILRVLELEPRHFGAISGFGQICLRHDRPREALAAFEVALGLNPHLAGIRAMIDLLRNDRSLPLH